MATQAELAPFLKSGGILETVPLLRSHITEITPRDYSPDKGPNSTLELVSHPDPKDPTGNNLIAKYEFPQNSSWPGGAQTLLKEMEFEYDSNPAHQYLYARNLKTMKKISRPTPDNWEVGNFRILKLAGGQLLVWVYWYRDITSQSTGQTTKDNYATAYVWPICP